MTIGESFDEFFDGDYDKYYSQKVSLALYSQEIDSLSPIQKPFAERIQLLSERNNVGAFLVDSRILVEGPSDAFRAHVVRNWELKREDANWWNRFEVSVFVSSMVVVFVGAFFSPPIAIAGLVSGAASAIFACQNYHRAKVAQDQIDRWEKHPAEIATTARSKAYTQGFFYCLTRGLKGSYGTHSPHNMLHPNEVTWLYEQSLTNMKRNVESQMQRQDISPEEKTRWVEQFIAQNPLSTQAIAYAYEPQVAKRRVLEVWSSSFHAFKQDVSSAQEHFAAKFTEIHNQAQQELRRLGEQRTLALAIPLSITNASNDEARKTQEERLKREGISPEERNEVLKEYEEKVQENKTYYTALMAPIHFYYNKCEESVKAWRDDCLAKIEQEKASGIAPYFKPALELFTAAYDAWKKQKVDGSTGFNIQEALFEDLAPIPSAPPWEKR